MKKFFSILFWLAPFIIGVGFLKLSLRFDLSVTLKGFDSLLGSMIGFTSMIIGFYSAFFGLLIAIKDTSAMKKIRGTKVERNLKYLLYMAVFTAFVTLILSMALQILQYDDNKITQLIVRGWFLMVGIFGTFSFQTVALSLELVFNNDPIKKKNLN